MRSDNLQLPCVQPPTSTQAWPLRLSSIWGDIWQLPQERNTREVRLETRNSPSHWDNLQLVYNLQRLWRILLTTTKFRWKWYFFFLTRQPGQTGQTFKLDFLGNLCRAAFAILVMFTILVQNWLVPICPVPNCLGAKLSGVKLSYHRELDWARIWKTQTSGDLDTGGGEAS